VSLHGKWWDHYDLLVAAAETGKQRKPESCRMKRNPPNCVQEEEDADAGACHESGTAVVLLVVLVNHVHGLRSRRATESVCVAAVLGECRS